MAVPLLASGIALSAVTEPLPAQQATDAGGVHLRVARFWRGEGRTLKGVVGLPVAQATRNVTLEVLDSTGKSLYSESWVDSASAQAAQLAAMNAETTTPVQVVLNPGLYRIAIRRSENGVTDSTSAQVRGFDAAPVLSDLVVSARMRVLAENEQPASAEMQRGRYAIERGTRTVILPTDPKLWYYVELYRQGNDSIAEETFRVMAPGRATPLVNVQRSVAVGAGGTVDAAALPLQGLPPGDYTLAVTVKSGAQQEERSALFHMGSFADVPQQIAPPVAATAVTPGNQSEQTLFTRYFAPEVASDAEINRLMHALTVSTPGPPVKPDITKMTTVGQRRFLAQYWSKLPDPNPATATHEMLDEYRQRVAYVEAQFKEKGGRPGVDTDRGRIYMKYGPADATQHFSIASSNRSVVVWKYTRAKPLKYAFLDTTGFEHYSLVYTTDPLEQGFQDWEDRIGDNDVSSQVLAF